MVMVVVSVVVLVFLGRWLVLAREVDVGSRDAIGCGVGGGGGKREKSCVGW